MKKYNFSYYGTFISRSVFVANVPENWESMIKDGCFSWSGYDAVERED